MNARFNPQAEDLQHLQVGPIRTKLAMQWATRPKVKPCQSANRLGMVRRFAAYVSAHDARTEVPAQKLLPYHFCRRDPYHYSDENVLQIILVAKQISPVIRDDIYPQRSSPAFFVWDGGDRLIYTTVNRWFLLLACQIGLRKPGDPHGPRVHDLRHYFAIRTLLNWYQADADVEARLPELATYLGHVHVRDSYWYLSAVPELLQLATLRLERAEKGVV